MRENYWIPEIDEQVKMDDKSAEEYAEHCEMNVIPGPISLGEVGIHIPTSYLPGKYAFTRKYGESEYTVTFQTLEEMKEFLKEHEDF